MNKKQKAAKARWVKHPWVSVATKVQLTKMYHTQGMTQREIATVLRVSLKAVQTAMRNFKILPRKAIPRCRVGAANPAWKGRLAGYQAKHLRIQTMKGKPQKCEVCGTTDPNKKYEWASMTGNFDEPSDYKRMCICCHRKHDNAIRNLAKRRAKN